MGIKVYTYTPWYVKNCEDEVEFMNESENKKSNYVNLIKDIVEPFKNEDCVCDVKVWYNDEDDMYLIDVEIGMQEMKEKFFAEVGRTHYVKTLRLNITKSIIDYLPIKNFYVGSYGKPNCEWNPNISEAHKVDKDEYTELYRQTILRELQNPLLSSATRSS